MNLFINLSHFILRKTNESSSLHHPARNAPKNDLWWETQNFVCGPEIISFYCAVFLGLPYRALLLKHSHSSLSNCTKMYFFLGPDGKKLCDSMYWGVLFWQPPIPHQIWIITNPVWDHYLESETSFFKIWKYPLTLTNCNEKSKVDFQFTKLLYPEAKCGLKWSFITPYFEP